MSSYQIPLANGVTALVDHDDVELVSQFQWTLMIKKKRFVYAQVSVGDNKTLLMHRLIMGASDGEFVDHINGNGLDNRRQNLRICTHAENVRNRRLQPNKSSGFCGVGFSPNRKLRPWRASITVDSERIHLGYFSTAEDAAHAYDNAARYHCGEFARVNFPRPGERPAYEDIPEIDAPMERRPPRMRSSNTTGFRGVSLNKSTGRWVARIGHKKTKYHIGTFDSMEEAARAYDQKAKALLGHAARLNFPEVA